MRSKTNGLGQSPDEPDEADEPDRVSSAAARDPPTTRAGGQDDGSYTKLPQINIYTKAQQTVNLKMGKDAHEQSSRLVWLKSAQLKLHALR